MPAPFRSFRFDPQSKPEGPAFHSKRNKTALFGPFFETVSISLVSSYALHITIFRLDMYYDFELLPIEDGRTD